MRKITYGTKIIVNGKQTYARLTKKKIKEYYELGAIIEVGAFNKVVQLNKEQYNYFMANMPS